MLCAIPIFWFYSTTYSLGLSLNKQIYHYYKVRESSILKKCASVFFN